MKDNCEGVQQAPEPKKRLGIPRRPVRLLSLEQARTALAAGKGSHYEVLLSLALVVGLRAGELLALHWQDVDWEVGALEVHLTRSASQKSVSQPPFLPAKHPRRILLPRSLRDQLQAHALRQQQERRGAEIRWQPTGLIVRSEQGYALSQKRLASIIQEALLQAHLPVLRFQEMRHSTASLLLLAGIAPHIISAILGIGARRSSGNEWDLSIPRQRFEEARQTMEQLFFVP
jgi:integrase